MKIEIEIPREFEEYFNVNRFKNSLYRLAKNAHLIAGNYEWETAMMFKKVIRDKKIKIEVAE